MWTQNYIHSKAYKFLITACMGMTTVRRSRTFKAIQKKEKQGPRKFRLEWPLTWKLSGAEDTEIAVSHTQPAVSTSLLMYNTWRVMVPH